MIKKKIILSALMLLSLSVTACNTQGQSGSASASFEDSSSESSSQQGPHVHSYGKVWTSDDTYHWHKCLGTADDGQPCPEVGDKSEHTWDNGETVTPAITDKDCLIAISGSGETSYIVSTVGIAKSIGSKIIAITSYPNSTLAKNADLIVELHGRTKVESENNYIRRQISGQHQTLSPLGTLFEVSALIFLDATIAQMMHDLGQTEKDMKGRHTVLE